MYDPSPYLLWARRFYGTVPYDLAASGIPVASRQVLGMPVSLENPRAWDELRTAIAAFNDVPLKECVAALGTSHALWLAYAALLAPGDDVLVEHPSYEPVWLTAQALGANVRRFDRLASEAFRLDPGRIAKAMTKGTRVVVVTNLHNPSGVRADDDTLREVAELCAKRNATLLIDEVYAPFDDLVDAGGVFHHSSRKLAPNVVAVSSLTKCFGLGLERIGWLLGPPEVVDRAAHAVTLNVGATPLSHANLAVHAFSRIGTLADRAREILRGKRELVEAWVAARPDLTWSNPDVGLFALITTARNEDLLPAIEAAVHRQGVVVAPGTFFGVPNAFRISWSLPEEKLLKGLELLDAALPPTKSAKAKAGKTNAGAKGSPPSAGSKRPTRPKKAAKRRASARP